MHLLLFLHHLVMGMMMKMTLVKNLVMIETDGPCLTFLLAMSAALTPSAAWVPSLTWG